MEVEHIDENTIRVRIDKEELAARGLKVLDLLGNRKMIQHFFYSILSEVDEDHTFANNSPVSFQVMPSSDGLDLLISKEDGANLPSNFGKFMQPPKTEDGLIDFNKLGELSDDEANVKNNAPAQTNTSSEEEINQAYYAFKDLGDLIELAPSISVEDLASSLYLYQGTYFLNLRFLTDDYVELDPKDAWALANEYGTKVKKAEMRLAENQGKCIFARDALGNINRYFN